jgi:cytochrome P450
VNVTTERAAPIFSPQFFTNPYPTYRQHLRGPVLQPTGVRANSWAVFRYEACTSLLREQRWSAARAPSALVNVSTEELREFDPLVSHIARWLLMMDPPAHTSLRKLMNKGFAPLTVERLRPRVQAIVQQLMDDAVRDGQMDVLRDVAYPLPVHVISDLLGLPQSLYGRCVTLSNDIAAWLGNIARPAERARPAQAAILELTSYFEAAIAQRGSTRGDDLLSLLLNIKDDAGSAMTLEDLYAQCVMLLFAGHETTRNLIGNGLYTFLTQPEAMSDIQAEPQLMRSAVEEILRYESPVQAFARVALSDIEVDGVRLQAGASLTFVIGAAHRDPAQFPEPDRFDLKRAHNRHMAFGADAHVCIGSTLARLEGSACLSALIERFPRMKLAAAPLDWGTNLAFRGLRCLPIKV